MSPRRSCLLIDLINCNVVRKVTCVYDSSVVLWWRWNQKMTHWVTMSPVLHSLKKWALFCRWWDYCLLQEHKDDSYSKKGFIPCSDKRKKWLHSAAGGKEQGAKSQGVGPGTQGKYIESKANNFHHRSSFKYKIVIFIPYVSSGPVLLIGPESRMP